MSLANMAKTDQMNHGSDFNMNMIGGIYNRSEQAKISIGFKVALYALIINFYFVSFLGIAAIFSGTPYMRVYGISLDGYFRIVCLPVLLFFVLSRRKIILSKREKFLLVVISSFFILFLIQIIVIPDDYLTLHYSRVWKYVFFFLALICLLLHMSKEGKVEEKVLKKCFIIMFFLLLSGLVYYVYRLGLGHIFHFTGRTSGKFGFLMLSGNEDANGFITLLPIILFHFREKKRLVFAILVLGVLFLIFNGTRTAQMSFLFMTYCFYFVTVKKTVFLTVFILLLLIFTQPLINYLGEIFKGELIFDKINISDALFGMNYGIRGAEGTFMGRLRDLWLPIIYDTFSISPIFGLGTGADLVTKYLYVDAISAAIYNVGPSFHNMFIYMFALGGICGLYLFFCLLFILLGNSVKIAKTAVSEAHFEGLSLFFSAIGYIIWCLISNANTFFGLTILIMLIAQSICSLRHATWIRSNILHSPSKNKHNQ